VRREVRVGQAAHVRCVLGPPFARSSWTRTGGRQPRWTWPGGFEAEHRFDRLPVLADALQDAGCDHDAALAHLRGPGPHFPGCFVLAAICGRG